MSNFECAMLIRCGMLHCLETSVPNCKVVGEPLIRPRERTYATPWGCSLPLQRRVASVKSCVECIVSLLSEKEPTSGSPYPGPARYVAPVLRRSVEGWLSPRVVPLTAWMWSRHLPAIVSA